MTTPTTHSPLPPPLVSAEPYLSISIVSPHPTTPRTIEFAQFNTAALRDTVLSALLKAKAITPETAELARLILQGDEL